VARKSEFFDFDLLTFANTKHFAQCDRCAARKTPIECMFKEGWKLCALCQKDHQGCWWGGVNRTTGVMQRKKGAGAGSKRKGATTTGSKTADEPRKRKRMALKGKGKAKKVEVMSNDEETEAAQPPRKSKFFFDFRSIIDRVS
jgi:hypothetical protein